EWLFETFGAGERDWLDFNGRRLPEEAGFYGLLATLMDRANGGNDFTDLIGAYLRTHGVAGLVFPSARTNTFAVFRDSELVQSGGWNLVDYRHASDSPLIRKLVWMTDWGSFPDSMTRVEVPPTSSPHAGSFRVKGNEEHHNLLRHLLLCFKAWEQCGDQTPVKGYRWHSTRSFAKHGKKAVAVTCEACGHETGEIEALFSIPASCPECGS